MLKIFNDLEPFFADNYSRIHVRAYAKQREITPPTASKLLERYFAQGLLKKEVDRHYNFYFANKESELFRDLHSVYWKIKLQPLVKEINKSLINPIVILFGSVAKAEVNEKSDIDIAIFSSSKKKLNFSRIEKAFARKIQAFYFTNINEAPQELRNNILNGKLILGMW